MSRIEGRTGLISIISIHYKEPALTKAFLQSVRNHSSGENIEVILIDNDSNRNSRAEFENILPGLVYVHTGKNLGFAAANNLGIRRAKGDFLAFFNNDTLVTAGLISILKNEIEKNPEIGIVSPLIISSEPDNLVQYGGFTRMNFFTGRNSCVGLGQKADLYPITCGETGYCHGAAMMTRASLVNEAGLMPENYFLYYEELEWCENFRKAGKKIWFCGKAKIYHRQQAPSGNRVREYFLTRNRMLFVRRNSGFPEKAIFVLYFMLIAAPIRIMAHLKRRRPDLAMAVARALLWNITHDSRSSGSDIVA